MNRILPVIAVAVLLMSGCRFESQRLISWKQESLDAGALAILQNAKADLHRRSIPLRAVSSRALCRRMDALEKSFDKAFEAMVTQEYYLRCFEDVFDQIVPPKVEGLYR